MEVKQAAPKVAKIDMSLDEVVKTGLCRHTVPCAQPTVPRWRAHSGRRQPRLSRSFVCAPCRQRRQRAAGARQSQHARAGTQPATNSTGHYSMLSLSPPSLSLCLSVSLSLSLYRQEQAGRRRRQGWWRQGWRRRRWQGCQVRAWRCAHESLRWWRWRAFARSSWGRWWRLR